MISYAFEVKDKPREFLIYAKNILAPPESDRRNIRVYRISLDSKKVEPFLTNDADNLTKNCYYYRMWT
jgi:hypothetical protein